MLWETIILWNWIHGQTVLSVFQVEKFPKAFSPHSSNHHEANWASVGRGEWWVEGQSRLSQQLRPTTASIGTLLLEGIHAVLRRACLLLLRRLLWESKTTPSLLSSWLPVLPGPSLVLPGCNANKEPCAEADSVGPPDVGLSANWNVSWIHLFALSSTQP